MQTLQLKPAAAADTDLLVAAQQGSLAAQEALDTQQLDRIVVNGRTSQGVIIARMPLFSGQITSPGLDLGGVLNYGDIDYVSAAFNISNNVRAIVIERHEDGTLGLTHECLVPAGYKIEGPGFRVQRRGRDLLWTATAHALTANADGSRDNVLVVGVFDDLLPALALPDASPWTDVPRDHWAFPYVWAMYHEGAVSGYSDGTFRGGAEVNRFQDVKMIAVAAGLVPE